MDSLEILQKLFSDQEKDNKELKAKLDSLTKSVLVLTENILKTSQEVEIMKIQIDTHHKYLSELTDGINTLKGDQPLVSMYRDESVRLGKEINELKNRTLKLEEFNKYFHGSDYVDWT